MPPVEGSLRGGRLPRLAAAGGSSSAMSINNAPIASDEEDEEAEEGVTEAVGLSEPAAGVLEDAPARRHKAMNPTTRKQSCRYHKGVVVKRSKLRSAPVLTPCWRCLEVGRGSDRRVAGTARCICVLKCVSKRGE